MFGQTGHELTESFLEDHRAGMKHPLAQSYINRHIYMSNVHNSSLFDVYLLITTSIFYGAGSFFVCGGGLYIALG